MRSILILTGSSRGIGKALAEKYLSQGFEVIGLSRSESRLNGAFSWIRADLSHPEEVEKAWEEILSKIPSQREIKTLHLIYNAGSLSPMGLIGGGNSSKEFATSSQLNLSSPMILTEKFVQNFGEWAVEKKIVYISSGAGKKPYEGWGAYCASKAGLDMFAMVLSKEQERNRFPIKVASVAPGVVDTEMQAEIRQESEASFPAVQRFLDLKAEGKLWTPDFVASELFELVSQEDFGKEVLPDLRTWR